MEYLRKVRIKDREMVFPTFFPDATRGVIRGGVDSRDLYGVQVEGLIVNTYHLMSKPGATVVKSAGGINKFINWNGWIISDSGGFQLLSLIYRDSTFGSITNKGVRFLRGSKGNKRSYEFTPEKSIQVQFSLDSDIMICLDDCPVADASDRENNASVDRTIAWAGRCKEEFERQIINRGYTGNRRPLLFGVIQGGNDKKARERCAESLIEIGFDGYGFGGWPFLKKGELNTEILRLTAELMPNNLPKYALGVGNPQAVVDCFKMGFNIFDCVLPTRDARHRRLYTLMADPRDTDLRMVSKVYDHLYILEERYVRDGRRISDYCDCRTCANHSRSYLHHLFQIEDHLADRLATIHNLRTYTLLIENLRKYAVIG